jgi:xylan 1,4-beta-xylosidase
MIQPGSSRCSVVVMRRGANPLGTVWRLFAVLLLYGVVAKADCTATSGGRSGSRNQGSEEFCNPVLAGFYPDPSICRVGDEYYLVNSTFSYFPGITMFRSRDLADWTLIGYVLDRPEQLNLDGLGVSRGIFAPAIRYNKGTFYVTCTLVDRGGNFVVTSATPEGPWSNPVWLPQVNGIDPSLFFDGDSAYLVYNSVAPDNKPLYEGHRTLRMMEFDPASLSVRGKEYLLVNGGTNLALHPVWIEAPHIFKKDGFYYLIAAEGGTAENHSEVVFRSTSVTGPYLPYRGNPILTQRNLPADREFPVTCTGHADFVQTQSGEWWSVFLGCRPYRPFAGNYFNTGRETFLAPVAWENGWPIINPGHELVQYTYPLPLPGIREVPDIPRSGNFVTRDDFNEMVLNKNWMFLRTPGEHWYSLSDRPGFLELHLRPESCADSVCPSFVGRRQQHAESSVSTRLEFAPQNENEKAGLLVFQNERHFYYLCMADSGGAARVELYRSSVSTEARNHMETLAVMTIGEASKVDHAFLRIQSRGRIYAFSAAVEPGRWFTVNDSVDAEYLSTKVAGGFLGCMYAMYVTSLGRESISSAYFDWFEYRGDDEVYR